MADVFKDLNDMHAHYGFHGRVEKLDRASLLAMLKFRRDFLKEELEELTLAIDSGDPEGVVDSLVDLIVVAVGTLDLYNVDGAEAWDEVHRANMSKRVGIKANRPNPLGLPDLIKPDGWVGPIHHGNHGTLGECFAEPTLPLNPPTDVVK